MRRTPILITLLILGFLLSGCCSFTLPANPGPQSPETEARDPTLPPDGTSPTEEMRVPPGEPEPTEAAPSNWPIAYTKDNQIWIYHPATDEKFALTGAGSPAGWKVLFPTQKYPLLAGTSLSISNMGNISSWTCKTTALSAFLTPIRKCGGRKTSWAGTRRKICT